MRFTLRLWVGPMLAAFLFGCDANNAPQPAADYDNSRKAVKKTAQPQPKAATKQPGAAPVMAAPSATAPPPQAPAPSIAGTVLETMDAGVYTYVLLKTPRGDVWGAAPKTAVAVGDTVELYAAVPMRDFHSKTLDRTFEDILFASQAGVAKAGSSTAEAPKAMPPKAAPAPEMPPNHPFIGGAETDAGGAGKVTAKAAPSSVKPGDIEKLPGGHTVAELFAAKADLVGKPVKIRARVIKATRGIMGMNWMHIQDGTGEAGGNDVTVTSAEAFAPVGTTVVVEGTLQADKDIGAGYVFPVLIEEAKVTPEPATPAGGA